MDKKLTTLQQIELILNDEHEHNKLEKIGEIVKRENQITQIDSDIKNLKDAVLDNIEKAEPSWEGGASDIKIGLVSEANDPFLIFTVTNTDETVPLAGISFAVEVWDDNERFDNLMAAMKKVRDYYKKPKNDILN